MTIAGLIRAYQLPPLMVNHYDALPELDLPRRFSLRAARAIVTRIGSVRRRAFVSSALDRLIEASRRARAVSIS